jgi:hypothetical protein
MPKCFGTLVTNNIDEYRIEYKIVPLVTQITMALIG